MIITLAISFFTLASACYMLFLISDPLETVGGKLGKLLKLPDDVVASTFQALATSGPEIVMSILVVTPFISQGIWNTLELGEKASSGTLNMTFSAMDNLLGIGAVAMVVMILTGKVRKDDPVPLRPSTAVGLGFYIIASSCLSIFLIDQILTPFESWCLMSLGIAFVISQFFIPKWLEKKNTDTDEKEVDQNDEYVIPLKNTIWAKEFALQTVSYAFLVFGLIVFVRLCMGATFNMASVGFASVGGILLMFTSYVSSFPEFMLSFRYVKLNKQGALLGMLFGSNVIDLSFAGFRPIWLGENLQVYTTGAHAELLPIYIWLLPIIAICLLVSLKIQAFKWKHSYPLVVLYLVYVISGFFLL